MSCDKQAQAQINISNTIKVLMCIFKNSAFQCFPLKEEDVEKSKTCSNIWHFTSVLQVLIQARINHVILFISVQEC